MMWFGKRNCYIHAHRSFSASQLGRIPGVWGWIAYMGTNLLQSPLAVEANYHGFPTNINGFECSLKLIEWSTTSNFGYIHHDIYPLWDSGPNQLGLGFGVSWKQPRILEAQWCQRGNDLHWMGGIGRQPCRWQLSRFRSLRFLGGKARRDKLLGRKYLWQTVA